MMVPTASASSWSRRSCPKRAALHMWGVDAILMQAINADQLRAFTPRSSAGMLTATRTRTNDACSGTVPTTVPGTGMKPRPKCRQRAPLQLGGAGSATRISFGSEHGASPAAPPAAPTPQNVLPPGSTYKRPQLQRSKVHPSRGPQSPEHITGKRRPNSRSANCPVPRVRARASTH